MSLQVWLPLNGDLHNQGLANVTVTNNGATVNTAGKIGSCYSFDGSDDFISLESTALYSTIQGSTHPFSIAFWVYHADSSRAVLFGDYSLPGGINFNIELSAAHAVRFYWASSPDKYLSGVVATSGWTHVAIVYDCADLKYYKDGVLSDTYTVTLTQKNKTSGVYYLGRDYRTGSTALNGRLNDFRIYDHALSPLEVKHLAQGLVLHYPLNRGGFGGENLLKNSHYKYDNNAYYVGNYTFVDSSKLETGKTYTLSFNGELQDDTQTGWYFNIFPSPYTAIINKPTDKEGRFAFSFVMPENGGNRTSIGCYSLPLGNRLGCAIWDVKLEEGSTATPWTPAPSDALYSQMGLDNNIEYDVSGYGNNGTRVGTFSWSGDTPRYSVSTVFDGSNYISRTSLTADILTFSCWVKTSKNKSTSQIIVADSTSQLCISFYAGTIITFYGSSGYGTGSKCILGNKYKENDWNHIVVVKTGTDTRKVYCNGIEQVATSNDYWTSQSTGFTVGRRETSTPHIFYGQLSDLRVYATALSADDVMALYKNAGYVDSDGNVYAYEMAE